MLPLRNRIGTQPQRDMRRLHRLPHHPHQIVAQRVQVCFVTQIGREAFQGLPGIVLASVEAPVYKACMRRVSGVNNAAIRSVEATTARVDCSPVSKTKSRCNTTVPPKYSATSATVRES